LYKRPEVEAREKKKQDILQKIQNLFQVERSKPFTEEDVKKYKEAQRQMQLKRKGM